MPDTTVRIPDWANPQNASVLDNWFTRALRAAGGVLGAADPTAQAMALGAPVELPGGEAGPAQKLTQRMLKAYHGSGADFDAFDAAKIGTGEGTQAFSYGHYAAEREHVAQGYKEAARRRLMAEVEQEPAKIGQALFDVQSASGDVINGKVPFGPNRTLYTREQLAEKFADGTFDTSHLSAPLQKKVLDSLTPANVGKMYELNLHVSPDELLDWDKPLSEQPPKVQEALKNQLSPKALEKARYRAGVTSADQLKGSDLYNLLEQPQFRGNDIGAHAKLQQAGIKGTQFLDRASRVAGEGTRNYVIYPGNEHLIEIARKYGVALPAAAEIYRRQQQQIQGQSVNK